MNTLLIGEAITSLLGLPAFAFFAPEGTPAGFVTYTLTGLQTASTKDRYSYREKATVDILVVGSSYRQSVTLAQQVRQALEGFSGTVAGIDIDGISLLNAIASTDGVYYTHKLTYQITIV